MKKILLSLCTMLLIAGTAPLAAQEAETYDSLLKKIRKTITKTIKPYGNFYFFLGYQQNNEYDAAGTSSADKDLLYSLSRYSNAGFRFMTRDFRGEFELGFGNEGDDWKFAIRKAYGIYKMDFMEIMVGQSWTPYTRWSKETANFYRSDGFGALNDGPNIQLKFLFDFGLYIDIINPHVSSATHTFFDDMTDLEIVNEEKYYLRDEGFESTTKLPLDSIESYVPKFLVGYNFIYSSGRDMRIDINAGVATNFYKIGNNDSTHVFNKKWIGSYLAYLNTHFFFSGFILNINGGYAINPTNFGLSVQGNDNGEYIAGSALSVLNIATGLYEIKDTQNVQAFVELGYRINKTVSLFAGYGFSILIYGVPNSENDLAMEYYASADITYRGVITVSPTLTYRDFMKNMKGTKEGSEICAGLLAAISFN